MKIHKRLKDSLGMKEDFFRSALKGLVRAYDISDYGDAPTQVILDDGLGNPILEKENLIVLRGRTFALEKLFNSVAPPSTGYQLNLNRKVSLWSIGNGGAPEGDPFNPYIPEYSDLDLANKIPFITVDPDKYNDPEKEENPSIVTELTDDMKKLYYNPVINPDGTIDYYSKVFEEDPPRWSYEYADNEVYKRVLCRIQPNEARGHVVNELGLQIAEFIQQENRYTGIELFSRICFDTESLTNRTKQILFEYYIFA